MGQSKFAQDEDCLNLALWTPSLDTKRRPVLVWIHGGAYQSGGGDQVFYDGGNMAAAGDMVVVSINYRLGALGYLYLPETEPANVAPANRGLLDQIAAIRWVHENITAFGGDPNNVTVAGQSAGGGSTLALLSIPEARSLFHRAILQSAPSTTLEAEKAAAYSRRFHELAGVATGDIDALRALPAEEIVALQRKLQMEIATKDARSMAFQLVRDVAPIANRTSSIFEVGEIAHMPLLIGSTLDEGHAWMAQDEELRAQKDFDLIVELARNAFNEDGSGLPAGRREKAGKPWELLSAVLTWKVFERTALDYCARHSAAGGAAFAYRFDWRPAAAARYGACHCIEIPFLFDNLENWPDPAMMAGHNPALYKTLARATQDIWIAFAHNGNPQTPAIPEWKPWSTENQQVVLLDNKIQLKPAGV